MPTYNYRSREVIAKIVYYGPGRCGKTTNLQQIHAKMRPETRSDLLSVATETDRTIYFDLLPLHLGTISGMKFMARLYTVPGQVYYGETRRLVLKGADGVVFVADSQNHMLDENRQSLRDLKDNLKANGLDYGTMPIAMQWNKRDLPHLISEAELEATLNDRGVRSFATVAAEGTGVLETLRHITLDVFDHLKAGGEAARTGARAPGAAARAVGPRNIRERDGSPERGEPPKSPVPTTIVGKRESPPPARPLPLASDLALHSPDGESGPERVRVGPELIMQEFRDLAVMHSQLAERLANLEREMGRLGRENQEIREILARHSRA